MNYKSKISIKFNVFLIIYLLIATVIEYLFEPEMQERVPWDTIYDMNPSVSVFISVLFVICLILIGSKLFQTFWNCFIADVFKVRNIIYREALTILLIIGIVFE